MCLNLRQEHNRPYNSHKVRWKVIRVSNHGCFVSPFMYTFYNKRGWNNAKGSKKRFDTFGFHIFVSRAEARKFHRRYGSFDWVIKRIEVQGFLNSGTYDNFRSETWEKIRFSK